MKIPSVRQFAGEMVKAAGAALKGEQVLVDPLTLETRRDICANCDENDHGQCQKCTCIIKLMTLIATKKCPLDKWR